MVPGLQQIAEPLVFLDAPALGKGIAEDNCAMCIAADRAFAVACAEEVGTQRDRETSTFLRAGIVRPVPCAPRLSLGQPAPTLRRPLHQASRLPVDARYITEIQKRTDLAGNRERQQQQDERTHPCCHRLMGRCKSVTVKPHAWARGSPTSPAT